MSDFHVVYHSNSPRLLSQTADFRLTRQPLFYPDGQDTTWWSVLLELERTSIEQFENELSKFEDNFFVPACYHERSKVCDRQPLVIFAQRPVIVHLNDRQVEGVIFIHVGAATPERFLDRHARLKEELPDTFVDDDAVTVAVIDDGIAIAHDLFRSTPENSRVEFAHIFDASPAKSDFPTGVGRVLQQEDIDQLLSSCTFGSFLDEDLFYAETGQIDYARQIFSGVAHRRSHGTHSLSLAGGYLPDPDHPVTNRPIICSALPKRLIGDTTGLDLLPNFYLAFHILVKVARCMITRNGEMAPVVFNLSYGNNGGPHDGTGVFASLFEYYFEAPAEQSETKAWLTLPAGNSNLGQLHAKAKTGPKSKPTDVCLRISPDDFTSTQVQFWMPKGKSGTAKVRVKLPAHGGTLEITTSKPRHASLEDENGNEIARLAYEYFHGDIDRGMVTLLTNPTASLDATAALAPFGDWLVHIDGRKLSTSEPIELWVRRDEAIPGTRTGARQARFVGDDYQRFGRFHQPLATDPSDEHSAIRRAGTISGFACGASPIVVAAFTESNSEISDYSAAGPLNGYVSNRKGPDLAAKGDDSLLMRGVLSAGSRSGSWTRLSGTSVAAPRVARLASDEISDFDGTARTWSRNAQKASPVKLTGKDLKYRAGVGGIKIETFKYQKPASR